MLKRFIEIGAEAIFAKEKTENFQKYQQSHRETPQSISDAITQSAYEQKLIEKLQNIESIQENFTLEAAMAIHEILKKYGLEDLPQEYLPRVLEYLTPSQQVEEEELPVAEKKEKLPYELAPMQIRLSRAMFRLAGSDVDTVLSLRGSIRHEFAAEIANVPEESQDAEVEKWVQNFWPAKKPIFSKADAALNAMGIVDFNQPLAITEDQWSHLPDNTPIKQIFQNALQLPGLQGFSWEELKFILWKTGDVYLDNPEKNREILATKKKPSTDNS